MINILDKCQLGVASLSMQPNDRLLWCFVRLPAVENKTFAHEKKKMQFMTISDVQRVNLSHSNHLLRVNE